MIIVYTGSGKGKTTAAIGQIIRALGNGYKVYIIQLFKGNEFYGEQKILKKLKNLKFHSFAQKHPLCFPNIDKDKVVKQCQQALDFLKNLLKGKKKYDFIVLEEFNIAISHGFIKFEDLLDILKNIDPSINIIITGRGAPQELIEKADLVTEMIEIKHPYKKGIKAKKGIEF